MHNFSLRKDSCDLTQGDKWLGRLSQSEFEIIVCLYRNKDTIVSRETLLSAGWPNRVVTSNSLNVAIKNIRVCLEKINSEDAIETHVKKGFLWNSYYSIDINDGTSNKMNTNNNIHSKQGAVFLNEYSAPLSASTTKESNFQSNTMITSSLVNSSGSKIALLIKYLNFVGIIFLATLSLLLIVLYVNYWTPLKCHEISGAILCGVGEFRADLIPEEIDKGSYLFGYSSPNGEFLYVKI